MHYLCWVKAAALDEALTLDARESTTPLRYNWSAQTNPTSATLDAPPQRGHRLYGILAILPAILGVTIFSAAGRACNAQCRNPVPIGI
jgi:hypothetical protein